MNKMIAGEKLEPNDMLCIKDGKAYKYTDNSVEFEQPYDEYPAYSWDNWLGFKEPVRETWYCQHCGKPVSNPLEIARYNGGYSLLHYAHAPGGIFCGWLSPTLQTIETSQ